MVRVGLGLGKAAVLAATLLTAGSAVGQTAPAPATPAGRAPFVPTANLDVDALTRLVLERSPGLQESRLRVDLARAESTQSRVWENPVVDGSWSNVPIGETNPAGMKNPLGNVPNYSVGINYRFLLGKRGPRIDRADALARSAQASAEADARGEALVLAVVLGGSANAQLRIERLRALLDEGKSSLEVARARVNAGSGTPLEVDRLEIELSRIDQQILNAESELAGALATCSAFVGAICAPFPSTQDARAFLLGFAARARTQQVDVTKRPDIRALDATREAAESELSLARAQAIPDPTFRVGYVHDRFVSAGNQQNSINLSVALPIPLLDRGQGLRAAAEAREARARAQRERLLAAARVRVESLRLVLERIDRRQRALENEMLPRARAVVRDLEKAVNSRLIPVTDVIQARRTLTELLLEEIDAFGDAFRTAVQLTSELSFREIEGSGS